MKIVIDKAACVGHGRCAVIAGALYEIDDGGYIVSEGFEVPAGMETLARRGARSCPERIITVIEDASGEG